MWDICSLKEKNVCIFEYTRIIPTLSIYSQFNIGACAAQINRLVAYCEY